MSLSTAPRSQRRTRRPSDRPDAARPAGHPVSPVSATRSAPVPRSVPARRSRRVRSTWRIGLPRPAALIAAALIGGFAASTLAAAGVAELAGLAQFPQVLPVALAAASVGVGRLASWLPAALQEWRGPLGYATAAPWIVLLFLSTGIPEFGLPAWAPAAAGLLAATPFLWSAIAPGRLRATLAARPDTHGRRGAALAGGALLVMTFSVVRPEVGVFLQAGLAVSLAVAALTVRGLADAGATWGTPYWLALTGGALIAWASGPLVTVAPAFALPAGSAALVLASGLPLLALAWRASRRHDGEVRRWRRRPATADA